MNKQEIKNPSVRFNNFIEDWKKIKIINFSNKTFGGGTPKTSNENYWDGEIPWIQSSDLIKDKISNIVIKKKITKEGLEKSATKLVPRNSIAIVTRVGVGKVALMPFEYTTSQDFLSLSDLKVDKWFGTYSLYYKINQELNSVQGTSIKGITKKELLDRKTYIPENIKEQSKIGGFFKQLDGIITLQQQLLNDYKQLKKAMLQKMFPQKGESVPKIRFADFNGSWKYKKLENYILPYKEKTYKSDQYPILTSSRRGLFLQKDYYKGNQIASKDNTGYNIVPKGYFTYRHMSDDEIFMFNINELVDFGIVSTLYPVFTTSKELDSQFLKYVLNNGNEFKKHALLAKQGGSRTYMYLSKLENLSIKIPSMSEQIKIRNFFKQLDETIFLHEKKLETYQNLKKAMLQKMFV